MYIGEAAKRSGASVRAIRLYESMGLLKVARAGSYRVFSEADIKFIQMIKDAQSLGVHLSELLPLIDEEQGFNWSKALCILEEKQQNIAAQIKSLEVLNARIGEYHQAIKQCESETQSKEPKQLI